MKISRLYHAALARDSGERRAFLQQACTGDDALRLEVESLPGDESAAVDFIEAPVLVGSVGGSAALTGRKIATNTIGTLIDAGGTGEVYRAHDPRLKRDVVDGTLTAAVVRPGPDGIQADPPREWFTSSARMLPPHGQFVVTPDGQRFLMMLPSATREPLRVTVTSNWQADLRAIP